MKKDIHIAIVPYYLLISILLIGLAAGGSKMVSVMAEKDVVKRKHCIIIDAGHGGVDGGATSCTGVLESQLNLEIALRLEQLFHLLGFKTRMIRSTDISIYTKGDTIAAKKVSDLKERVRIVNVQEGGILVSIHQNTFSDSRYGGAQVFYPDSDGSKGLAAEMQKALVSYLNPGSNRQAKRGEGIYLLQKAKIPAILVECGFLSNHTEEAKLRSEEYQKKVAAVIAGACSNYLYSMQ
jgi:N-acetylmuramoyl-L-alanine amidase